MDPITITVRNNGSLFISGDQMAQVRLVDHEGNEISTEGRKALSLCRCGASTKKPLSWPNPTIEWKPNPVSRRSS